MKKLAIFWLSFFSTMAVPDTSHCPIPEKLRDPFISPQQEHIACPRLTEDHHSPVAAEKIKQWRLQGILGNRHQGFWALVVSHTGEWRSLRPNDRLESYQVMAIDAQQITFKQSTFKQGTQSSSQAVVPPPITLSLVEGVNTLQQDVKKEEK